MTQYHRWYICKARRKRKRSILHTEFYDRMDFVHQTLWSLNFKLTVVRDQKIGIAMADNGIIYLSQRSGVRLHLIDNVVYARRNRKMLTYPYLLHIRAEYYD